MISAKKSKRISKKATGGVKVGLAHWWSKRIRVGQEIDQCESAIIRASKDGKTSVDYPIKRCNLEHISYYDLIVTLQDKLLEKGYTVMDVSQEHAFYSGRTIKIMWEVAYD